MHIYISMGKVGSWKINCIDLNDCQAKRQSITWGVNSCQVGLNLGKSVMNDWTISYQIGTSTAGLKKLQNSDLIMFVIQFSHCVEAFNHLLHTSFL